MARPLSEEKRSAILMATTELVAEQGTGAATAEIARRAGVPNGSLFTYFDSKAALLNATYLELKSELTETILAGMPEGKDTKQQLRHIWTNWAHWGVKHPPKRKALAQLIVSDLVTPTTRAAGATIAAPVTDLVTRVAAGGVLRTAPRPYVGALVESMAATTMDFMISDPAQADSLCDTGFETLWRMLA